MPTATGRRKKQNEGKDQKKMNNTGIGGKGTSEKINARV